MKTKLKKNILCKSVGDLCEVWKLKVLVAQSCLTLWDPVDWSRQAPLSMEFFRQQYWSGLPFPSPGDLPNPGIEPRFPTLWADSLTSEPPGKPHDLPLNVDTFPFAVLTRWLNSRGKSQSGGFVWWNKNKYHWKVKIRNDNAYLKCQEPCGGRTTK